jgi:5-methyltetrahydrofolate--homocysteine methyltransferase
MNTLPPASDLARPLVADGAMGTMLFTSGLPAGMAPEAWMLEPMGAAAVAGVHRAHVAAGAGLVLAASFGANALRLAGSELAGRTVEVCLAAVDAARSAVGPGTIIAASMGPTGGLLAPFGALDPGEVRAAYAEQAAALARAGAAVLWIETMMDLNEALAALDGAREAAPGLPVVATMTFAPNGRTMFGDRPEGVAAALAEHGAAGVGANCGDGFEPVERVIGAMAAAAPGLHVVAKANAGRPIVGPGGVTEYPATAEDAAGYALRVADSGATIVGGCCGTTPAHIAAIARALAGR